MNIFMKHKLWTVIFKNYIHLADYVYDVYKIYKVEYNGVVQSRMYPCGFIKIPSNYVAAFKI